MKQVIFLLFAILLVGCAPTIIRETQTVEVLVPVKCEPSVKINLIEEYPFNKARKEMSAFEKYQLSSEERKLLRAENKELRAALAECTR